MKNSTPDKILIMRVRNLSARLFGRMQFPALLALASSLILLVFVKTPFSKSMPSHWDLAQQLLQGKRLADTAYPIGYPVFLALNLYWGGLWGVFLSQGILYLAILFLSYRLLRALEVDQNGALLACALIAFHPYLLLNIKRILDSNLATFLTIAFVLALVRLRREGLNLRRAIGYGLLFGYMVLDRQNMLSALPLALVVLWWHGKNFARNSFLAFVSVSVGLLLIAAVTILVKGRLSLVQKDYAAYNFYAGANPHAFSELIRNYNAEYSIEPALAEQGIQHVPFGRPNPERAATYTRLGLTYIRQHPWKYAGLVLLKIFSLFRPDYRRASASGIAPPGIIFLVQTLLALPLPIWIVSRWRVRRYAKPFNNVVPPLFFLWFVPFALSNVDPRLRLPMDIVLIIDTAYVWSIFNRARGNFPLSSPRRR